MLRFQHIKTRNNSSRVQCLCEMYENLNLKKETLQKIYPDVYFGDIYKIVNTTLCKKPDGQKWYDKKGQLKDLLTKQAPKMYM